MNNRGQNRSSMLRRLKSRAGMASCWLHEIKHDGFRTSPQATVLNAEELNDR